MRVNLIPHKRIGDLVSRPAEFTATMGLDGSIDEAFKEATSGMTTWVAEDYKLTPSEIAQVLGAAAEYKVSEAADRNAGVVLKLKNTTRHSSRLLVISPTGYRRL